MKKYRFHHGNNELNGNNNGFSLVELIVVVLIIAVIAVALSPQVIKWVEKSRENVQKNDESSIKTCVDAAVAEFLANGGIIADSGITYTIEGNALKSGDAEVDLDLDVLAKLIDENMQSNYPEVYKPSGNKFQISINSAGIVTVSLIP